MTVTKRFLHRMQLCPAAKTFNGRDCAARGLHCQHRATFDGAPVHMHHTGATLTGVAAHMRARESQIATQKFHQQRALIHLGGDVATIDDHRDCYTHQAHSRALVQLITAL